MSSQSNTAVTRFARWLVASFLIVLLFVIGCSICIIAIADDADVGDESLPCEDVSAQLVEKLERGLTITGGGRLLNPKVVKTERWTFIGAGLSGPSMGNTKAVWATASLDLSDVLIVAADIMAAEFSIWDFPQRGEGRFADQYEPAINRAKSCGG